jgi:hypothetical protein
MRVKYKQTTTKFKMHDADDYDEPLDLKVNQGDKK